MSIKILIVTGSYPPMVCGVGDYTKHLVSALSQQPDIEIGVLTDIKATERGSLRADAFFPVIAGEKDLPTAQRIFEQWKPDIVHIQYPTMGYATWGRLVFLLPLLAWRARIPAVATWHEPFVFTKLNWIHFLFLRGLIFVRPNYMELMPFWFRLAVKLKFYRIIENASTIPAKHLDSSQREAVRKKLGVADARLVAFFGFIYPNKKVEQIFEIADPQRDHIVLVGELNDQTPYQQSIRALASSGVWKGKATATGFLPAEEVANILASADAVVLPFEAGGGTWNTSIQAVKAQGTFLLTTSRQKQGYVLDENTYLAHPSDVADMRFALSQYVGHKKEPDLTGIDRWKSIAGTHINFYKKFVKKGT